MMEFFGRAFDHHFTGYQKAQYDSLSARGRTAYDNYRQYDKDSHEDAFIQAYEAFGLKKPTLLRAENLEALRHAGIDIGS